MTDQQHFIRIARDLFELAGMALTKETLKELMTAAQAIAEPLAAIREDLGFELKEYIAFRYEGSDQAESYGKYVINMITDTEKELGL